MIKDPVADQRLFAGSHGVGGTHTVPGLWRRTVDLLKQVASIDCAALHQRNSRSKPAREIRQLVFGVGRQV